MRTLRSHGGVGDGERGPESQGTGMRHKSRTRDRPLSFILSNHDRDLLSLRLRPAMVAENHSPQGTSAPKAGSAKKHSHTATETTTAAPLPPLSLCYGHPPLGSSQPPHYHSTSFGWIYLLLSFAFVGSMLPTMTVFGKTATYGAFAFTKLANSLLVGGTGGRDGLKMMEDGERTYKGLQGKPTYPNQTQSTCLTNLRPLLGPNHPI